MPDSFEPVPVSQPPSTADRLDSWKEIASYLGREVRTVQGWEKNEALPVHRHQHARQGTVYAFKPELDAWRELRRGLPAAPQSEDQPDLQTAGQTPDPADDLAANQPVREKPDGPARKFLARPRSLAVAGSVIAILAAGLFFFWKTRAETQETFSSIVVLPFLDLSPQKDQEYFSDGLTEELIDALSRVPNLHVVARTSAFSFKGKDSDIRKIGKQLNVGAVLEGSVRKSGDQLRITAQLCRVSDGYHFWSRTYDRRLADIFPLQREISQTIAAQLRAGDVPVRETTRDLEAYRFYQEGRYLFNQHNVPESYWKAIEHYQQAIQRDPNFALAYAGLADAHAYLAERFAIAPGEVMPKAKAAAQKAVLLDGQSADAHTSLGTVLLDYDRDIEGAQREFQKAMKLNPNDGYIRHWFAHSLEAQDRLDDAMREMRAALVLDPISIVVHWDIANQLVLARRYDDALRHLDKADELFPKYPLFAFMRIQAYMQKADLESAERLIQSLRTSQPDFLTDPGSMAIAGAEAALAGRTAEARKTLAQLEEMRRTQYVEPFMVIQLCAALHDSQKVALWTDRADKQRSTLFIYLPFARKLWGLD